LPRLQLDVDNETFDQLAAVAATERRPITWQAELVLRMALGLPVLSHMPRVDDFAEQASTEGHP
jgi:hypothetical protein